MSGTSWGGALSTFGENFDQFGNDIDNIARHNLNENNNRDELTHEIIGYLPYWEYAIYPTLDFNLITQSYLLYKQTNFCLSF